MGPKLYVGNIPFSVTEEKLKELFSRHGSVVSVRIITDKLTGRSKGFGFVEMGSGAEAERATAALNGIEFEGRSIVVSEARPQPSGPRRGGPGEGRPPR
ncbi:MAG: RNA-binding protein [Deltaproteobacteria bacterium]|nr:RNA-binding protein [Deltaproteobacteria bacterium]